VCVKGCYKASREAGNGVVFIKAIIASFWGMNKDEVEKKI
jgi:hypothetical protein